MCWAVRTSFLSHCHKSPARCTSLFYGRGTHGPDSSRNLSRASARCHESVRLQSYTFSLLRLHSAIDRMFQSPATVNRPLLQGWRTTKPLSHSAVSPDRSAGAAGAGAWARWGLRVALPSSSSAPAVFWRALRLGFDESFSESSAFSGLKQNPKPGCTHTGSPGSSLHGRCTGEMWVVCTGSKCRALHSPQPGQDGGMQAGTQGPGPVGAGTAAGM